MNDKNVVLISVDDLFNYEKFRTFFGVEIQTPNFDRLAAMGNFFEAAYANTPLCNPSRASIMTGQSVFETGIFNNRDNYRTEIDPASLLPAAFHDAGYRTSSYGKNFHKQYEPLLDKFFFENVIDETEEPEGFWNDRFGNDPFGVNAPPRSVTDEDYAEHHTFTKAIEQITSDSSAPFFVMAGAYKPHKPWGVPAEYFDLYPLKDIKIPSAPSKYIDGLPDIARQFAHEWGAPPKKAIQSYLASITFADAQVGRLLDAMDENGRWADTTVVLWSDHGYHLGDKDLWHKFTLWEEAANAPLIVYDPDQSKSGQTISTPVNLNQIFPTLTELTGIETPDTVSAQSFAGLVNNALPAYEEGPVLTYIFGSIGMRSGSHRLIRYEDGSLELYNLDKDPRQLTNLADDPSRKLLLKSLYNELEETAQKDGVIFAEDGAILNGTAGDNRFVATDDVTSLSGKRGDDIYFITPDTRVVENEKGGTDTVILRSGDSRLPERYRLEDNIENLNVNINQPERTFFGNEQDNKIVSKNTGWLYGLSGSDTLVGTPWNTHADRLDGGEGADDIHGGPGDDTILPGPGRDLVTGSSGSDTFIIRPGEGGIVVADADPTTRSKAFRKDFSVSNDIIHLEGFGFTSAQNAINSFVDTDRGTELSSLGTKLVLYGVSKAELTRESFVIRKQITPYVEAGTADDDSIVGSINPDKVWAEAGDDTVRGKENADTIIGGSGDDALFGDEGADSIDGGRGSDLLEGSLGADRLIGGYGEDTLRGGMGGDSLHGGPGDDTIYDSAGADTVHGGHGDDVFIVGDPTINNGDSFDGGLGQHDTIIFQDLNWQGPVQIDIGLGYIKSKSSEETVTNVEHVVGSNSSEFIFGSDAANRISALDGDDVLQGRDGADVLSGGSGDDTIVGGLGSDTIRGGNGDDSLDGSFGNDSVQGGAGNDTLLSGDGGKNRLDGGPGDDKFYINSKSTLVFSRNPGTEKDRVHDFDVTRDLIDVSDYEIKGIGELKISKSGSNLILEINRANSVVFVDFYDENPAPSLLTGNFVFDE